MTTFEEHVIEYLRRFVASQEKLVELFSQREETDRKLVEIRQAEYDRLDRWREEDLERERRYRLEELNRAIETIIPKEEP